MRATSKSKKLSDMKLVSDKLTRRFDLNELDIRKNFNQVSSSTGRIPDKNLSSA